MLVLNQLSPSLSGTQLFYFIDTNCLHYKTKEHITINTHIFDKYLINYYIFLLLLFSTTYNSLFQTNTHSHGKKNRIKSKMETLYSRRYNYIREANKSTDTKARKAKEEKTEVIFPADSLNISLYTLNIEAVGTVC